MALKYDPEFLQAFAPLIPQLAGETRPAVHDVATRRANSGRFQFFIDKLPDAPDVETTIHHVEAADGHQIPVYSFIKKTSTDSHSQNPGPAILHCHGGGMILGSVERFQKGLRLEVDQISVPVFSVEYRLAPEYKDTTLVDDCYAALVWLSSNAVRFNIDPARIAVMGESAGGGIAAGVALMARDKNLQPPLAKQILIYPMLDDRNLVANEALEPLAFWKNDDNITGWTALLGDKAGKPDSDEVSIYAAPARAKSLAGLPPTYIDVGGLDIFRDEDLAYAARLAAENISTEFHLYPDVPHAFDLIAPEASVTKRASANRFAAMTSF